MGQAKWNALAFSDSTRSLTVPRGDYVLVKRFSAKEERRRIVAAVLESAAFDASYFGFENHLNFFHDHGRGMPLDLARGLGLYLNSSIVDTHFRQFSGHTQVNAADLRNMPYPSRKRLIRAGEAHRAETRSQAETDALVDRLLF